jgi:uncharacterized protein
LEHYLSRMMERANTDIANKKVYILYHSNCFDGFSSAWAAWKKYGERAIYIPVNYGEPLPLMEDGAEVYICDFSYPLSTLRELEERMSYVYVLDHHKTAMEDLKDFSNAVFDMNRSGCTITWSYFHPDKEVPLFLKYMQDRDIWTFHMPFTREIFALAEGTPLTFKDWDKLVEEVEKDKDTQYQAIKECSPLLLKAEAVMTYKNITIEKIVSTCTRWMSIDGHWVPVVNTSKSYGTECCQRLLDTLPNIPFAAYYVDEFDKRYWGFRSRSEFDVSLVAKKYGGGGHKNASGAREHYDSLLIGRGPKDSFEEQVDMFLFSKGIGS